MVSRSIKDTNKGNLEYMVVMPPASWLAIKARRGCVEPVNAQQQVGRTALSNKQLHHACPGWMLPDELHTIAQAALWPWPLQVWDTFHLLQLIYNGSLQGCCL